MEEYQPRMSLARVERLQQWHEEASEELHALGAHSATYLGLELHIPDQVFPPTPTSDLLGRQVQARVAADHRVLDMGSGAGANAILAAQTAHDVVAVDINPVAVEATAANAVRNGVGDRVHAHRSDMFDDVDGDFDVIVIDPPFRWFRPRDLLEQAFADENYAALRRFMSQVSSRLRPGGEVLLFFGTSGDVDYLDELTAAGGLVAETVAERTLMVRGEEATYFVRRLTVPT